MVCILSIYMDLCGVFTKYLCFGWPFPSTNPPSEYVDLVPTTPRQPLLPDPIAPRHIITTEDAMDYLARCHTTDQANANLAEPHELAKTVEETPDVNQARLVVVNAAINSLPADTPPPQALLDKEVELQEKLGKYPGGAEVCDIDKKAVEKLKEDIRIAQARQAALEEQRIETMLSDVHQAAIIESLHKPPVEYQQYLGVELKLQNLENEIRRGVPGRQAALLETRRKLQVERETQNRVFGPTDTLASHMARSIPDSNVERLEASYGPSNI